MSFSRGSPSYLLNDSYSSDEDNFLLAEIAQTTETITRMIMNNNKILMHYLERQGNNISHRVGSVPGHAMINRNRENSDRNLFDDYFAEDPRYNEDMFRRRYRMSRNLFLRIVDAVKSHDNYFQQRRDGVGKLGLSTLQKVTATFRMLAYGLPADAIDEYLKIGESTAIESIKRFFHAVVEIFSYRYLREPNANDIARLLYIGQQRGFPGILGSLDCMHWKWKNCPTAWAGQYTGRSGSPTIILEAVVDYDLWIWHAYFGMPGNNNDINVLDNSNLFSNLANGIAPSANYTIQGKEYTMGYYLTDNIYPKWATLVQTIREPQTRKKKLFAMKQEACRKDMERALGVLQARFAIVAGPSCFWATNVLQDIMRTCIIMHNMIIEDERDLSVPIGQAREAPIPDVEVALDENERFVEFLKRNKDIKDKDVHYALRNALIDHIWDEYTNGDD